MDSINSSKGSMESSSGGGDDEEYSSRPVVGGAGSIAFSSFLMNGDAHQLQLLHQRDNTQQQTPPLPAFDALPNFFDQLARPGLPHRNHQQLFQLGAGVGGDELGVMLPPSARSTSVDPTGVLQLPADLGYCPSPRQIGAGSTGEATNPPLDPATDPLKPVEGRPAGRNNNNAMPPRRNPKKRTRASRRAPTTVLTTDTSNFRAMVQEFTGIPAPPFDAAASLFQRGRFDLFGTNFSGIAAGTGLSIPPSSPSYLLRPYAQRLLQSSQLPPTSLFIPSTTTCDNTASPSAELLFPLISDNNNNDDDNVPHNPSPSFLEFGQALAKYSSSHNHERGQEQRHHDPHSPGHDLGAGGINNVLEEFCLGRQGGVQDRVRGNRNFTDAPPPSAQNVGATNRSNGGMSMESWICSSD